jgi:hypothetical protein
MNSNLPKSKRLALVLIMASLLPLHCFEAGAQQPPAKKKSQPAPEKSLFDKLKDAATSVTKSDPRAEKFFKDASLTKDQIGKFNAILSDLTNKAAAIDKKLTPQEQVNRVSQLLTGVNAQVNAMLTPDQRRLWAPYYGELSTKLKQDASKTLGEGTKVIGDRNKKLKDELKD